MSEHSVNRALTRTEFKGFSGIDVSAPISDKQRATDIVNFRILPDGSLKKRSGYRLLTELPMEVRAILTGYFGGEFLAYVIAGDSVYKVDMESGGFTHLGYILTVEGKASIFYYMGHIYAIDGEEIYDICDDGVKVAKGYAPLLGKDWKVVYGGAVNEPLNLLTDEARIEYLMGTDAVALLPTMYPVKEIRAVYVNGERVDSSRYKISEMANTIHVSDVSDGDRILAYLIFKTPPDRSRVVKNTAAAVFGGINSSRVFMWNGEDDKTMFASGYVTNSSFRESERIYSGNGALYFPQDEDFIVGDGRYPITAVNRHYDRLLIFTEGDTWMSNDESIGNYEIPTMRINSDNGCSALGAVARCGNDPVSVSKSGILRWTSNTDELEDCNSYSISKGIEELLPDDFFNKAIAFTDRHNDEIVFCIPEDTTGRVFIYGISNKQWYCYDGIRAQMLFDGPDGIGFVRENKLYIFDDKLTEDMPTSDEHLPIIAEYSFAPTELGEAEGKKRIMNVTVVAELVRGDVELSAESDNGIMNTVRLSDDGSSNNPIYQRRLNTDRFRQVKLKLKSSSSAPQRIYSVTVTAKP